MRRLKKVKLRKLNQGNSDSDSNEISKSKLSKTQNLTGDSRRMQAEDQVRLKSLVKLDKDLDHSRSMSETNLLIANQPVERSH